MDWKRNHGGRETNLVQQTSMPELLRAKMEGYGSFGGKEGKIQEILQRSFVGIIWWLDGSKREKWRGPGDFHDSFLSDWVDDGAWTKKQSPGEGEDSQKNDKELWSAVLSLKHSWDLLVEVSNSTSQVSSRPVTPFAIPIPSPAPG